MNLVVKLRFGGGACGKRWNLCRNTFTRHGSGIIWPDPQKVHYDIRPGQEGDEEKR